MSEYEVEKPSFDLEDTFNYNLSEYDVALHDDIRGNPVKAPKHVLNRVLWDMGMNTKGHIYKTVKQTHRTLGGKQRNGLIFCGKERHDKEWMQSGCATMAGMIDNERDWGLKEELLKISRQ